MKHTIIISLLLGLVLLSACKNDDSPELSNKDKALALINAFETGDTTALSYVSDQTYIQHNLAFPSGKEVLRGLINGSPTGFTTQNVRIFEDGDIVVMHNIYGGAWNNGDPQVAFDVFRFSNGLIVEHWDNLGNQIDDGDGTSQTDGPTTIGSGDAESNRSLLTNMANDLFIDGNWPTKLRDYFNVDAYVQHSLGAGPDGAFLESLEALSTPSPFYSSLKFVYAEGNFGITLSEGPDIFGIDSVGTYAYYDLFRMENDKIVEHWDVIQLIPTQDQWANNNGKW